MAESNHSEYIRQVYDELSGVKLGSELEYKVTRPNGPMLTVSEGDDLPFLKIALLRAALE